MKSSKVLISLFNNPNFNYRPVQRLVNNGGVGLQLTTNKFSTSSASSSQSQTKEFPPNSSIVPKNVNNRNPRNLEKLRIADKPDGWRLEKEGRSFWNKVTLDISSQHITASIVHYLGQKPLTSSTKEWCIKKHLYSTSDASAAKLVGQVLAQRCLQSGITEVACYFPEESRKKEKIQLFIKAMEDGGVELTEGNQVPQDWYIHNWKLPETPWEVHEGVDDNVLEALKLPHLEERKQQKPNARAMMKKINEFNQFKQ